MTPQQQHADELRDLVVSLERLRALFVMQRDHFLDRVQAATRDIEETDEKMLRVLEVQRDLAAEVERRKGVAE
jgi:alkylhydroperoxidase family enzyme